MAWCSPPRRSLLFLDKPGVLAFICHVPRFPPVSGLYSPGSASPALSAGLRQGLVLDCSLQISLCGLSQPAFLASVTSYAGLSGPSPLGGSALGFPTSASPFLPCTPIYPVTGPLHILLWPPETFFCPSPPFTFSSAPLHPSALGSGLRGGCLLPS